MLSNLLNNSFPCIWDVTDLVVNTGFLVLSVLSKMDKTINIWSTICTSQKPLDAHSKYTVDIHTCIATRFHHCNRPSGKVGTKKKHFNNLFGFF